MNQQFSLSKEVYNKLLEDGVTPLDFFRLIPILQIENAPASKVSIMHYIDSEGDYTDKRNNNEKIVFAIAETLPIMERMELMDYLDFKESGYCDEN